MLRDRNNAPISNWSPASKLMAITPDDNTDLAPYKIRGIYVGTGGDVSVIALHDTDPVTLPSLPAGSLLPLIVKRVRSTGTTASNLIGFM